MQLHISCRTATPTSRELYSASLGAWSSRDEIFTCSVSGIPRRDFSGDLVETESLRDQCPNPRVGIFAQSPGRGRPRCLQPHHEAGEHLQSGSDAPRSYGRLRERITEVLPRSPWPAATPVRRRCLRPPPSASDSTVSSRSAKTPRTLDLGRRPPLTVRQRTPLYRQRTARDVLSHCAPAHLVSSYGHREWHLSC